MSRRSLSCSSLSANAIFELVPRVVWRGRRLTSRRYERRRPSATVGAHRSEGQSEVSRPRFPAKPCRFTPPVTSLTWLVAEHARPARVRGRTRRDDALGSLDYPV